MSDRTARYRCLFCDGVFVARVADAPLLHRFCPRCRDLYIVATEAVARHRAAVAALRIVRPPDLPHCGIVVADTPAA